MQAMDSILGNGGQIVTNITSYDVLADPSLEGVVGEYQLDNYKKNVGNNRLKVFLTLHQPDYDRARANNNVMGCESIVTNVLHTLNKKCVPTGRFLLNTIENVIGQTPVWKLMGDNEAKQLIHGILKRVPPPDVYSFRLQQQQMLNSNSILGMNGMVEHKRRRRSSLLRRSASDTLLDDSKKVTRFDQQQRGMQNRRMSKEEPTWSSSRRMTNNGLVSLNRMDVILTSTMDALDPNSQSIGNNRLHILVAMQSGKYQQSNDRQKEAILEEVMQTVNSFWKGRFLTESMSGHYEVLDHFDVKRSLRHIFDMRSGQNLLSQTPPALNITPNVPSSFNNNSQIMRDGNRNHKVNEVNKHGNPSMTDHINVMRHGSTSTINNGLISNDTKNMLSRQMSASLLPTPMPSSALPLTRIEPPVGLQKEINHLRSAAVKSLQKQKARQQVASKLEKGSIRNSQQQQQLQQQMQQPIRTSIMNGVINNNYNNFSSFSSGGAAKRRQSSIFGTLDPSVMDEIVDGCFDDED